MSKECECLSRGEVDNLFKLILLIAVKVGINEEELLDYLKDSPSDEDKNG